MTTEHEPRDSARDIEQQAKGHYGMSYEPREWQKDGHIKIDACNRSGDKGNIIPVNACVGSGKTEVACYAFGSFIAMHLKEKTVQMFVTPRIRLCAQQAEEIAKYVEDNYGLKHGVDFDVIQRDCEHPGFDCRNTMLGARHAIFVVCDKSLWGDSDEDKEESSKRWNAWVKCFKTWESEGRAFGTVALDEAHNFSKNRLQELIFGEVLGNDDCKKERPGENEDRRSDEEDAV